MNGAFLGLNQSTKVTSKVKHKCASQQTQGVDVCIFKLIETHIEVALGGM